MESLKYVSSLKAKASWKSFLNLENYVGSHAYTAPCSFGHFDSPPLNKVEVFKTSVGVL